jgi:hypothetical protein
MSNVKPYKVLKAISFRLDRIEAGSVIHATDEEAKNIGVEYLQLVDAQGAEKTDQEVTTDEVKADEEVKNDTETGQETSENDQSKTTKHIVTEEDLKNNPELAEEGVKVGDEIDVADTAETDESTNASKTDEVKADEVKE